MTFRERILPVARRVWFALLVSAIAVVFSEKMYWYVTGYGLADLIIGYFFPAYVMLWLIDAFHVRRIAPLFLVAAVFGFIAEGILVGTIYEGGPLGLFNVSYTPLAWHAPLSILFGWYWLGQRLAAGSMRRLVAGCAAVGLLWGLWAMAWWLPENAADPALLAQGARLGQWPVGDFARHAFTFTAVLALAHWLLGRGGRLPAFAPSRIDLLAVGAGLLFFFTGVLMTVPWAPLKLAPLLAVPLAALASHKRREPLGSLLVGRPGPARPAGLLALLVMPAVAVVVYAAGVALSPPTELLYLVVAGGGMVVPAVLGGIAFVVALLKTISPAPRLDSSE